MNAAATARASRLDDRARASPSDPAVPAAALAAQTSAERRVAAACSSPPTRTPPTLTRGAASSARPRAIEYGFVDRSSRWRAFSGRGDGRRRTCDAGAMAGVLVYEDRPPQA